MIESILKKPSAVSRHKQAPLLKEREQFLTHYVQHWLKTGKEIPNHSVARIFAAATSILKAGTPCNNENNAVIKSQSTRAREVILKVINRYSTLNRYSLSRILLATSKRANR